MKGILQVMTLAGFWPCGSQKARFIRLELKFPQKGQTPYVGDEVEFSAEKDYRRLYLKNSKSEKNSLVRPPILSI